MTRAAIYVRISQDREGGGLGVQRQEDDCRLLADRLGYESVETYADNDVSAYSGKPRPQYERLLRDISSGKVGAVLVWHNDRLHRSTKELIAYMEIARDIPTHSVKSGLLDLASPTGRMTATILGAVAQQESEHKSERQRRKADELATKGLPLGGGRPFGYENDGVTIRESEAVELRAMVARVLAGDSLGSIIRDLDGRGVRTTRGNKWTYSSLRSLLLRERNCARMQHRGVVGGMASWDPIVTETDHDAVGAVLSNPARRTTPGSAHRHLLSGLAKCHCGLGMKPGWVKSKGHKYWIYTCRNRSRGHAHRNMERVDDFVIGRVLTFLDSVYIPEDRDDGTAALEVERSEIVTRLEESAELFTSGSITAGMLAAISQKLTQRSEEILEALNASTRGTALEGVRGITREQWDALPLARRRAIIDAVLTIEVRPLNGERGVLGVSAPFRSSNGHRFGWNVPTETRQRVLASLR